MERKLTVNKSVALAQALAVAIGLAVSGAMGIAPAQAQDPAPHETSINGDENEGRLDIRCKKGADERLLTVVPKDAGCELHYAKGGQSKVVANSKSGLEVCERVRANISGNLKKAGYACQ